MNTVSHYCTWLIKIISWNRLKSLEILLTFLGVGDVSFHYKLGFSSNCLKLNSILELAQQKWEKNCPGTSRTVKKYNYNTSILPKWKQNLIRH